MTTAVASVDWISLLVAFCPDGVWDDRLFWDDGSVWRDDGTWTKIATSDPTDGI